MRAINRRRFLHQGAAALVGGTWSAALAAPATESRPAKANPAGNGAVRIGFYSMSRALAFAPYLSDINPKEWKEVTKGEPPRVQPIAGARLVAVFDADKKKAEQMARLFPSVTFVADTPEALIGKVDAVMVNDDGTMRHQDQAVRFLKAGIPTWIDKPLARDPAEAKQLFALAARHKTWLMSCSMLRYAPEAVEAKKRLRTLGGLRTVHAYGPNELIYYGIHPTELCYAVLGPGIVRVQNIGEAGRELVRMDYADGRQVVLQVCQKSAYSFQATLYAEKGWFAIEARDNLAMARGLVADFVESVRKNKPAISQAETLEIIRVLAGAETSRSNGGAVVKIGS